MAAMLFLLVAMILVENSHQEYVYIKGMSLTSIPEDLVSKKVTVLHAENNDIVELDSIPKLPTLKYLYLSRNKLYSFPNLENVAETLEYLYLEYNNISYINSDRLDMLAHLKYLYLTQNSISSIPDVSGPSDTLTLLKLDYNAFTTFPRWEVFGKSLTYLNLIQNEISEVTADMFRNITKLTSLYLEYNNLRSDTFSLPGSLNLTALYLTRNSFTEFPDIGNITTLINLKLSKNQLTNIPEETFSKLTSLQTLFLDSNQIPLDGVPDVIGPNGTLVTLYLGKNPIKEMPRWNNLSKSLVTLSLKGTTVSELTDEDLDYFPALKSLDLSTANLSEFPYLPRHGSQLTKLNLYNNKIERLTEVELQPLQNLSTITCSANRLTSIPNLCFANFKPNFNLVLKSSLLTCDTKMALALGAREAIASYQLDLTSSKCSQPAQLQNQYVENVPIEQMENPIG
ncbi:hypothetical protein CAPTEDRAFT_203697, partial [Capitella teleta]